MGFKGAMASQFKRDDGSDEKKGPQNAERLRVLNISKTIMIFALFSLQILINTPYTQADNVTTPEDMSEKYSWILKKVLNTSRYDADTRPNFESGKVDDVDVSLYIFSLDSINEINMEYKVKAYLRMQWTDPRLSYKSTYDCDMLKIDERHVKKIWVPDLIFLNEKSGAFHQLTIPNKLARIYPNGTVQSSMRLSVVLQCSMDLRDFPLDSQKCLMEMMSWAYDNTDINLRWAQHKPVEVNGAIHDMDLMPEFLLKEDLWSSREEPSLLGDWSVLTLTFILERRFGFYFIAAYLPSLILVMLSWIPFWTDTAQAIYKTGTGFGCITSFFLQYAAVRRMLPKVSYIKAIDVWMITCLVSMALSLVESALCHAIIFDHLGFNTIFKKTPKNGNEFHMDSVDASVASMNEKKEDEENSMKKRESRARWIDEISRIFFPGSFILFNLIYWSYFITHGGEAVKNL